MGYNPRSRCAACGAFDARPLPPDWEDLGMRWCDPCMVRIKTETPWWTPQMRDWQMWRHIEIECHYCHKKYLPPLPGSLVCSVCAHHHCPRCGEGKSGVDLLCDSCCWSNQEEALQKYGPPEIFKKIGGGYFGANPDCTVCSGNGYYTPPEGLPKLCECRKNDLEQKTS